MQAKLFGLMVAIFGLLLTITPVYIFPPCQESLITVSGASVPMKCFWSGRAELAIGLLICAGGILLIFFSSFQARLALSLLLFLACLLALAVPVFLIGGCKLETMACQMTTFPAVLVLASMTALFCLANVVYLYHQARSENF